MNVLIEQVPAAATTTTITTQNFSSSCDILATIYKDIEIKNKIEACQQQSLQDLQKSFRQSTSTDRHPFIPIEAIKAIICSRASREEKRSSDEAISED